MLILTRGLGQPLLFDMADFEPTEGSQMEVVILGIERHDKKEMVKFGIRAPKSVKVVRIESFYNKKREVKQDYKDRSL